MLGKLLKYDLSYVYKVVNVFYLLAIAFAVLTRIFGLFDNSVIIHTFAWISSGITIALLFSILINTMMRLWNRVLKNMYGDESYLTHTLPVSKTNIYTSKFLSSVISTESSILVVLLVIFIAYYSKENMETLKALLSTIARLYDTSIINFILTFFVVFALEFLVVIQAGFTGLILGHRANSGKMVKSIIYGFGLYLLTMFLALLVIFIFALFRDDVMKLFTMSNIVNLDTVKFVLYIGMFFYLVVIVIFFVADILIFKRGVNVE